jgi:hypothetical protein
VTEKVLLANVRELAGYLGWLSYHTHDSRRSDPGFMDLILVRDATILAVELKAEKGRVTVAQQAWLDAMWRCGIRTLVWRPTDWTSGVIEGWLRGADEPQPKGRKR